MGRTANSPVWDYFSKSELQDGDKTRKVATCSICQSDTSYSNNTSNQLNHLRIHHKETFDLIEPQLQRPAKRAKTNKTHHVGLLTEESVVNIQVALLLLLLILILLLLLQLLILTTTTYYYLLLIQIVTATTINTTNINCYY